MGGGREWGGGSKSSVVVGEDGGKHGAPGVVAIHRNQLWRILSDDVATCGHRWRVAGDEDRVRKYRSTDGSPRARPRLRVDAKTCQRKWTR